MNLHELLANRFHFGAYPTPIQKLPRLSAELGAEIFLKRDDMTESVMSGNKIRKLEYLFRDAADRGASVVITTGGVQSNHARATVYMARRIGMHPVVVLIGDRPETPYDGNLFLDWLAGAEVHYVPAEDFWNGCERKMASLTAGFAADGRKAYPIPMGGSSSYGHLGYLNAALEIARQEAETGVKFDTVVCAVGTGGTMGGLLLARKLTGFDKRIVGVNVSETAEFFRQKIAEATGDFGESFGMDAAVPQAEIEIRDGFVGPGYARTTDEGMDLIRRIAETEGAVLDPVYTGKAFQAMMRMIETGDIPRGSKVLFLHTGGIYGLFPLKNQFFRQGAVR